MTTKPKHPAPRCHRCGSHDITATSSQQMHIIRGEKRQVADAVCESCGNTWWSVHPTIRRLARELDKARTALLAGD